MGNLSSGVFGLIKMSFRVPIRDRSFITFWGGGGGVIFLNELFLGGNFLPCTKSEGGKILRHTKVTNYMYLAIILVINPRVSKID